MADFGDAVFVEVKERGSLIFREDSWLPYPPLLKVETIEYNSHPLFIYPSSHKTPPDGPRVKARCLTKTLADQKNLLAPVESAVRKKKIGDRGLLYPASVPAVRHRCLLSLQSRAAIGTGDCLPYSSVAFHCPSVIPGAALSPSFYAHEIGLAAIRT